MCAEVCVHESENWQFFLLFLLYPERGTISELYHNRDIYIFEFSQDHVTKNQPVAVPV